MKGYYTYEICSSATPNIPFYIGKGKDSRMYAHKNESLKGVHKNKYLQNKILKLLSENNTLIYRKIVENVSEEAALKKEIERISECKQLGIKLCNLTEGGEGTSGRTVTNITREKLRKAHTGSHHRKHPPQPIKSNIQRSITLKGRKFTQEHKDNIGKAIKGKIRSNEFKNKVRNSVKLLWERKRKLGVTNI